MDSSEKKASRSSHHKTAPQDRVPILQKIAIGIGEVPSMGTKAIENLAFPVFHLVIGIDPLLVGLVMALTRFWDAFTDPLAGTLSDNTRTRFGRRRPYLFGSSVLCGLTLPLIYLASPEWNQYVIFTWFLVTVLIFYTAYSFFNVPLMAIAYEATPDYHERTRVYAYKMFFLTLNSIAAAWLFRLIELDRFGGSLQGARAVSLGLGAIMIVFGLIPAFLVRERNLEIVEKTKGLTFADGLRETLKNKPFLILCIIAACRDMPGKMIETFGLYILLFYVFAGQDAGDMAGDMNGYSGTFTQLAIVLLLPTIVAVVTRLSKTRVLRNCLMLMAFLSCSKFVVYSPVWPWLILIHSVLMAPVHVGLNTTIGSMMADVCDYDEIQTGRRREGMYASIYSWIQKAVGSVALLLGGGILKIMEVIGFESGGTHIDQSSTSVLFMRLSFAFIPAAGLFLALAIMKFFPIDEEKAYEIRAELEKRRGADYVDS